MRKTTAKTMCDGCSKHCMLSSEQRECYMRIPAKVDPVWHPCFDDADAKARFFGEKAKQIASPRWTLFPEVPEQADPSTTSTGSTLSAGSGQASSQQASSRLRPSSGGQAGQAKLGARKAPYSRKLLSKADEAQLFLRYNYARFRLSKLAEKQRKRASKSRALAMLEWHDRTQKVRGDLVAANMSLVVAMARRTRIPNVEFPELISEGNMALLRAIGKFDVSRGFKFSTYACRAILQGFNRMAGKTARHNSRFGVQYDPDLEVSDHDVHKHEMQRTAVIDDLQEIVAKNRAELSQTEWTIVVERFGLAGRVKGKTLAKVGKMLGLSNERVRQIQKEALAKIREVLNEHYLAA